MPTGKKLYGLTKDDVKTLRDLKRRVGGGSGSRRPPGVRRRVREGNAGGNVIYAQVNEASGVGPSDPTFAFNNAVPIVGVIPTDGEGTAQNQYAQTYGDNDWVLLFQEKDTLQWLTERGGGESGSQVVTAELTEDKTYADVAKLAKPVLADGTLDSGADDFYLIDDDEEEPRYWGLAAYTDGDTEAAAHIGYRYRAYRITDDWASSGKPGFRIIDGEGPADEIIVILKAAVSSGSTTCDLQGGTRPQGGPDAARLPRLENASYDLTVYDDYDIAGGAGEDDIWWARWDRETEHYVFKQPFQSGFHVIKGTSPGVVRIDSTFTLGSPVAVQGELPSGTITVYCDPKIVCPAGQTVYARYDVTKGTDDTDHWSTADAGNSEWILKGYPQYDAALKQLVTHDAGTVEWNDIATVLNWLAGYSGGPDQSIGHDGGDVTEWQNDGECES